jgi:hypothetical protein
MRKVTSHGTGGIAFFNTMGLFGGLFMVPIFLQQVMGFTALQAGLLILPALPFSSLSGLLTGRLSDRFPPPFVAIAGLLTMMAIFQAFTSVTVFTTVPVLLGYNILYRVFMDTVSIPITLLTLRTLAVDQVRMGQGLLGVVRSIGASFGVTVAAELPSEPIRCPDRAVGEQDIEDTAHLIGRWLCPCCKVKATGPYPSGTASYHCWRACACRASAQPATCGRAASMSRWSRARATSAASARISMAGKRVRRRASVHCNGSPSAAVSSGTY